MSHKLSALEHALTATRKGKGREACYEAACPLCDHAHRVDVLGSDRAAEVAAMQNIVQHLRAAHADEVDLGA